MCFGMLLLDREDRLHEPPRRRIGIGDVADDVAVRVDGDALGDQILLDHLDERTARLVLGVAARDQTGRVQVGRAPELGDALGDAIGVHLLLVGVLQKLLRDGLGVDATGHEIVPAVARSTQTISVASESLSRRITVSRSPRYPSVTAPLRMCCRARRRIS